MRKGVCKHSQGLLKYSLLCQLGALSEKRDLIYDGVWDRSCELSSSAGWKQAFIGQNLWCLSKSENSG